MSDTTETFADWSCGNCDTTQQLFLEKGHGGWWKPTSEAQDMLELHMSGECEEGAA